MSTKLTIVEGNANDKDNVRVYMVKGEKGGATWGQIDGDIANQTDLNTFVDTKIEEELANFEYLDYKVADAPPTPTEVIIGGVTYPTEEGVRYLVKLSGVNKYEEYILVDGTIYDIGTADDVNLDNYYNKTEVDALLKKGVMTASRPDDYTLWATDRDIKIPLTESLKFGNGLSLNNGEIKIGAGVSFILVSAQIQLGTNGLSASPKNLWIKKNGVGIVRRLHTVEPDNVGNQEIIITPILVQVTEGDSISVSFYGNKDDIIYFDYDRQILSGLTVQVVG